MDRQAKHLTDVSEAHIHGSSERWALCKAQTDAILEINSGVCTIIIRMDHDARERDATRKEEARERKAAFWKTAGIVVAASGVIATFVSLFVK
jgi:anti-sigma-K factor RskA